jgi:hypothetical protein
MALAAATVWEVRTTGNNANGGAFVTGASGTDRSQQAAAQIAYTDLVLATTTTLTSALNPFSAAEVGNILNITGGAGFTTGWYQIVSVSVVTATIDRVGGTLGSTGGTGNLGGALATPTQAITNMVGQNTVWIKKDTYLQTVTQTPPAGVVGTPTAIKGYNVTRGDLEGSADFSNHPSLKADNVTARIVTIDNAYVHMRNLVLDGGTGASKPDRAETGSGDYRLWSNCQAKNCTDRGFLSQGSGSVYVRCQVTALVAGATSCFYTDAGAASYIGCTAIASAGMGFYMAAGATYVACIASGLTGGTNSGFRCPTQAHIIGCVSYNNAGSGILILGGLGGGVLITDCILSQNGRYGIEQETDVWAEMPVNYNAFYANTSGARLGVSAGANDVTLTADPFTNAAGNDFTLNNTSGGGAACRGAGFPGVLPGL